MLWHFISRDEMKPPLYVRPCWLLRFHAGPQIHLNNVQFESLKPVRVWPNQLGIYWGERGGNYSYSLKLSPTASLAVKKSDWSTLNMTNRGFVRSPTRYLFWRPSPFWTFSRGSFCDGRVKWIQQTWEPSHLLRQVSWASSLHEVVVA